MIASIIDTHINIWDFTKAEYAWLKGDRSILNRNYAIEELDKAWQSIPITEGVLVQAANNFEDTNWMLEVASKNDWITGVVGWVPLDNPAEASKALQHYSKNPLFKGVRHLIHNESDPSWLLQQEVLESLGMLAEMNFTYDVVGINSQHLMTAIKVAEKLPDLKMVLDHLNQPPVASQEMFGEWGELIKKAAAHKNIYAKISGLGGAANNPGWTAGDIKPYIEFVLTHFGADRCFCGGDWPVSLLAGSYEKTWQIYKEVLSDLLPGFLLENVYSKNAKKFYRL
jgi:L-fuconolactonase